MKKIKVSTLPFKVKKLNPNAKLPYKGSSLSAGYDLFASEACKIAPGDRKLISTGLAVACPPEHYARIAPRSGLAVKNGIDMGAGVVDADYRGEVKVLLFNFGQDEFEVKIGDRIAQMIVEKIAMVEIIEVEDLNETERGEGGFGSTGIN